ncbi:WD40 repeat domain-containing protein [Actinoplanes rectilineatus]|uniref:WD40 repeat domain-containing protein n=1 Tax=Actinoplanes rectilineatus TaxID=113571 RepID=UPI0012FA9700|nr:hypothetical protein [Actinoplanes rectilineatus]
MVSEINGLSGQAEASVKVPFETYEPSFHVFQDDAEILIAERRGGYFSVVDATYHEATPVRRIDDWPSGATLVRGYGQTYVVDTAKQAVFHLDSTVLTRRGRPARVNGATDSAVIAEDGTLWVAAQSRGVVVPVRSGVAGTAVAVARPGERLSLVSVDGRPMIVNWTVGEITGVSGEPRLSFPVDGFTRSRTVSAAVFGDQLVLAAPDSPRLVLLDLTVGASSLIDLGVKGDYGSPVLAEGRLYVPDRSRGVVLVRDLRPGSLPDQVSVSGRAAPLEAFVKGEVVWVNDPSGPDAVAIYQGVSRRIKKYRTSPTGAVETPSSTPPPSVAPPKTATTASPSTRPSTSVPPSGAATPSASRSPTSPGSGPSPSPGQGNIPVPTRLGLLTGPYFPAPYTEHEMSFSANSKLFALDGIIYGLAASGTPQKLHEVKASWPTCNGATKAIAFDPAGEYLVIAGQENQGCLLSADGQRLQAPLIGPEPAQGYKWPSGAVAYSPKKIVAGDFSFNRLAAEIPVRLWDVSDPETPVIVATVGEGRAPHSLTFSHNGNLLLNDLTLWDVSDPKAPNSLATLNPVDDDLGRRASFTDDGEYLAAGGRLWSLRVPGRPTAVRMPGIRGHVLAVNPAGTLLVVVDASYDENNIQLWDIRDQVKPVLVQRLKADWPFPDDGIAQVIFSPNGRVLAVMGGRSTIRLWQIRS